MIHEDDTEREDLNVICSYKRSNASDWQRGSPTGENAPAFRHYGTAWREI